MIVIKGIKLVNGDISITNRQIDIIDGNELLRQTIETVTNTNKGEWFNNPDEGITFNNVLGKQIQEDIVRSELLSALIQVDSSFYLKSFEYGVENRKAHVSYVARNAQNEEIGGEIYWR